MWELLFCCPIVSILFFQVFGKGLVLFRKFVLDCLKNYERENYGDISREDTELNGESRWLGNGDGVMGRYGFFYDNIVDSTIRVSSLILL